MQDTAPDVSTLRPDGEDIDKRPRTRRRQVIFVGSLLIFALLVRLNLRQGQVVGNSMEPTFYNATTVLVWKTAPRDSLRPGDVIIFRDNNGEELIKRIALIKSWQPQAPSGSYIHPNGGRLIPFAVLFDDYFKSVKYGSKPQPAAENTIYVLGDNLVESDDSRSFGPISPSQILGKVIQ